MVVLMFFGVVDVCLMVTRLAQAKNGVNTKPLSFILVYDLVAWYKNADIIKGNSDDLRARTNSA